jgi:hypothetical protein
MASIESDRLFTMALHQNQQTYTTQTAQAAAKQNE